MFVVVNELGSITDNDEYASSVGLERRNNGISCRSVGEVDGEVNSVHEGIIIRIRNNQVLTLFGSIRLFVNYVPWLVRLQQSAVFWVHCNSGDLGSFLGCLFKTLMLV